MVARIVVWAILSVVTLDEALADYVNNYSRWRDLSPQAQGMYAMGLFDGVAVIWEDNKLSMSLAIGLNRCGMELKLNGPMLAEAVTRYYETHTGEWGIPTSNIFINAIGQGVCLRHVNEERAKVGLEPWPVAK